jgi:hypothetical protein
MALSPNGTDDPNGPSSNAQAVTLAVLGEVLMETYRTSAQVKLLMRSLSDDMTDEVDEDRDTVRQALEAIAEGDVKAKVEQLARRLDARGVDLTGEALAPLADALAAHLPDERTQQP